LSNRDLRKLTAELRGLPAVSAGQMTYDLRRLRSPPTPVRPPIRLRTAATAYQTAIDAIIRDADPAA
jgi:hypothetical protein